MSSVQHTDKSPSALRTIGEVAEQLDVPQHVLRFWESKFQQIMPEKHRGRRYYRQDDVATLQQIKVLLYQEGYTIKGVQNFLNQKSSKHIHTLQADLFPEANEEAVTQGRVTTVRKNPASFNKQKLEDILSMLRQSRDMLQECLEKLE